MKKSIHVDLFPNIDLISYANCPVFVLHGLKDEEVPVSNGQRLYEKCKNKIDAWWVENTGHNDIEIRQRKTYISKLQNFLNRLREIKQNANETELLRMWRADEWPTGTNHIYYRYYLRTAERRVKRLSKKTEHGPHTLSNEQSINSTTYLNQTYMNRENTASNSETQRINTNRGYKDQDELSKSPRDIYSLTSGAVRNHEEILMTNDIEMTNRSTSNLRSKRNENVITMNGRDNLSLGGGTSFYITNKSYLEGQGGEDLNQAQIDENENSFMNHSQETRVLWIAYWLSYPWHRAASLFPYIINSC
eukprot:TRINITY_DN5507_c0_g1_i2.p1 TRINITY_DN5507_c0_g1~~TRINITY_DN5507_c0_g1_i2.p1  ORF type:complete len:305 (+),score=29.41 TRINITY_DN5507_c0_g1_i2:255-1169(+)